jgi:hypothetical protein
MNVERGPKMKVLLEVPELLARQWCRVTHKDPMWPVNGRYRCPECLRTYEVPWANSTLKTETRQLVLEPLLVAQVEAESGLAKRAA